MKTDIKYGARNKPEFISELRDRVSTYFKDNNKSKYGGTSLALKSIFMLTLYLAPYLLMMTGVIQSFWGVLACWILIGLGKAGVGMGIMHDAIHRSYSKNQTVNKIMGSSLYLLGGFPANWQYQHNTLHHGFTNIEGHDEDIDPGAYLRLSPHKPLFRIHRFQFIYAWFLYGLMTLMWVTTKDFKQLVRYRNEKGALSGNKSFGKLLALLIFSKVVYYSAFLLVPMLLLPFAWYWILFFFLVMHLTSGFVLTVIFQTAHVVTETDFPLPDGEGRMENSWAVHQLHTTANFAPGNKILSWLMGGLNHQVEHHLFPNISHVHYGKIAVLVKETAAKYNLPYHVQPSFLRALASHAKMLWHLGRNIRHPAFA